MYTYKYPHAAITADCVVFGFDGRQLSVLLIERGAQPFEGCWALPGGFMRINETIEECAKRELREETNVQNVYLEQFHVYSEVARDSRERVVTVAFIALVRKGDYHISAGDDAANTAWFDINELPPLAFDHATIVREAHEHLKMMLRNKPLAFRLLDEQFAMGDLQRLYEAINDTTYDRRNFAKKMNASGYIHSTPATKGNLYSFAEKEYEDNHDSNSRYPFSI